MADGNVSGPPLPTGKSNKPVSEALLNEKVCEQGSRGYAKPVKLLDQPKTVPWTPSAKGSLRSTTMWFEANCGFKRQTA
jgi:hypothetical protein